MVLGLQCGGYVVSGANTAYTPTELAHQLSDSSSALVRVQDPPFPSSFLSLPNSCFQILCHPINLTVALAATALIGWTPEQQEAGIVLAVPRKEASPSGAGAYHLQKAPGEQRFSFFWDRPLTAFKSLDELMTGPLLSPHRIKDPKNTVAYLGYSSGTSGKAKGVRTSHYNMTVSFVSQLAGNLAAMTDFFIPSQSVLSILFPIDIGQQDVQLVVLPLSHIYGAFVFLPPPTPISDEFAYSENTHRFNQNAPLADPDWN